MARGYHDVVSMPSLWLFNFVQDPACGRVYVALPKVIWTSGQALAERECICVVLCAHNMLRVRAAHL